MHTTHGLTNCPADEPQPMRALRYANEIRMAQVQLKRGLAADAITLQEALDRPEAQRMAIGRLLGAQRRWGRVRVHKTVSALFPEHATAENKTVESLTDRQREALLAAVAGEAGSQALARWCARCSEQTIPKDNGRCPWCDGRTA